jgi:hypothetical protein
MIENKWLDQAGQISLFGYILNRTESTLDVGRAWARA